MAYKALLATDCDETMAAQAVRRLHDGDVVTHASLPVSTRLVAVRG